MNESMILNAMDRIEALLSAAADKAVGTWDIHHDINNARQVAKSVKAIIGMTGLPAIESEKQAGKRMERERKAQQSDVVRGKA